MNLTVSVVGIPKYQNIHPHTGISLQSFWQPIDVEMPNTAFHICIHSAEQKLMTQGFLAETRVNTSSRHIVWQWQDSIIHL